MSEKLFSRSLTLTFNFNDILCALIALIFLEKSDRNKTRKPDFNESSVFLYTNRETLFNILTENTNKITFNCFMNRFLACVRFSRLSSFEIFKFKYFLVLQNLYENDEIITAKKKCVRS